jgi:oxalate decarboxylase/phosphoglucose isomerase-like protein (cupin superfamily)
MQMNDFQISEGYSAAENLLDLQRSPDGLSRMLAAGACVVYKNAANTWKTANSTVTSSPIIDVLQIFNGTKAAANVAVNFVSIRGTICEPLHYHTSHLIGVVIHGDGVLKSATDEKESNLRELQVGAGDVILIPRGAYHIFDCEASGGLDYIALEFSDHDIDYQKHWSPN